MTRTMKIVVEIEGREYLLPNVHGHYVRDNHAIDYNYNQPGLYVDGRPHELKAVEFQPEKEVE